MIENKIGSTNYFYVHKNYHITLDISQTIVPFYISSIKWFESYFSIYAGLVIV